MPPIKLQFRSRKEPSKYGVVATSIQNLKEIAKEKFKLLRAAELLVIELEDGTIVDDEDYFSCLDKDTCLVVSEPKIAATGGDTVDGLIHSDGPLDGPYSGDSVKLVDDTDLRRLTYRLHKDVTNIVKFSNQQLEVIANATLRDLSELLNHMTREEIEALQDACHTHLVEREKTTDAIYLLKLVTDTANENSQSRGRKKPRLGD